MQLSKNLWLLAGLAALSVAQDDSVCDPENDDNNDQTCTSSAASATSAAPQQTTTGTDADGNPLIATITDVSTSLETDTNLLTETSLSSIPSNLRSSFVPVVQTVSSSVASYYVPNSLYTSSFVTPVSTDVDYATQTTVVNTLSDGSVTTSTSTSETTSGSDSDDSDNNDNDDSGKSICLFGRSDAMLTSSRL